jgi:hypothetical protein
MNRAPQTTVILFSSLLTLVVSSQAAIAQDSARALEGVWAMSITLRDCATTAPLGPPFRSLLTFHAGGTMSESPGLTQFAPGQRSPGHGVWSFAGGNSFTSRFVAMILFDIAPAPPSPGFLAGWQVVASNFTLLDANRLSLAATVQFFDINRNLYRTACPTGTAERFQ